ncbi:MAG: IS200/IS605 family transposase [Flavobacteriales bacterium]
MQFFENFIIFTTTMSGTFSQLYVQVVFAVKGRKNHINPEWEQELYKYITGIVTNKAQKLIAIGGIPNHIHIFIGFKPSLCISDLVREIKKSSNEFINNRGFIKNRFQWQEGYGAFTYSHSAVDNVVKYILNQKEHHKVKTFKEEYVELLKKFEIDYKPEFLFDWEE